MMASNRAEPPAPSPPEAAPAAPPPSKPTHGLLPASPFLNGFDWVLAVGVVALGFGLASFAVANSDFWQHLAAGRLLANGQYEFGKDPFSYVGADRYWVNHAWLFDFLTFEAYSEMGGRGLVLIKAGLLAALTALLLGIRTGRRGLWISVLCMALALLSSAPRLLLQPALASMGWLGVTLFLLVRVPTHSRKWLLPVAIGITFWFWSNCDQWFFLGPLTLALYLIGAIIERRTGPPADSSSHPAVSTLALALAAGVVACMLNPHHVRVWRLPAELFPSHLAETLGKDPYLASLFAGLLERGGLDFTGSLGGNPVNAYAVALLLFMSSLGFVINRDHFSWGLLLINVCLLILAVAHYRALPFFAIVAGPTAAINWGAWLDRLRQRPLSSGTLQTFAAGRVGMRLFLFLAGLAALAACYPGWLHPLSQQRRLDWAVEPNHALMTTAKTLGQWRLDGKLPAEARGLILNIDLANYCAWFAPSEKTYFDLRIGFHEPDAETYLNLRRAFLPASGQARPEEAGEFLAEQHITHVVLGASGNNDSLIGFQALLRDGGIAKPRWDLWAINGQFSIFGWRRQDTLTRAAYTALQYNPLRLAFGESVEPLPDSETAQAPVKRDIVEKYLTHAPIWPDAAGESDLLRVYGEFVTEPLRRYERQAALFNPRLAAYGVMAGPLLHPGQPPTHPVFLAVPLLSVRAARHAVLQSPQHPDGYLRLALAYNNPFFDSAFQQQKKVIVAATLERYFARATTDDLLANRLMAYEAAVLLASLHFQVPFDLPPAEIRRLIAQRPIIPRADLGLEALRKARLILHSSSQLQGVEEFRQQMKPLDELIQRWEEELRNQENRWLNNFDRNPSPVKRALDAQQHWLCLKSLEELKKIDLGDQSSLTVDQRIQALLSEADVHLVTGQAELAEMQLDALDRLLQNDPELLNQPEIRDLGSRLQSMRLLTAAVLGKYSVVSKVLDLGLEKQQTIAEHIRIGLLPQAAAQSVARRLTAPFGMPLIEALVESHRPQLGLRFNGVNPFGLMGRPLPFALYDEFVLQAVRARREVEGGLYFQLALWRLEQGDNRIAAKQFRLAVESFPADSASKERSAAAFFGEILTQERRAAERAARPPR